MELLQNKFGRLICSEIDKKSKKVLRDCLKSLFVNLCAFEHFPKESSSDKTRRKLLLRQPHIIIRSQMDFGNKSNTIELLLVGLKSVEEQINYLSLCFNESIDGMLNCSDSLPTVSRSILPTMLTKEALFSFPIAVTTNPL